MQLLKYSSTSLGIDTLLQSVAYMLWDEQQCKLLRALHWQISLEFNELFAVARYVGNSPPYTISPFEMVSM